MTDDDHHCWHYLDYEMATSPGFSRENDKRRCCYCGQTEAFRARREPMPDHGPHSVRSTLAWRGNTGPCTAKEEP